MLAHVDVYGINNGSRTVIQSDSDWMIKRSTISLFEAMAEGTEYAWDEDTGLRLKDSYLFSESLTDSQCVSAVQKMLSAMGYDTKNQAGSFDYMTQTQLLQFQYENDQDTDINDYSLTIDEQLYNQVRSKYIDMKKGIEANRRMFTEDTRIPVEVKRNMGKMWVYLADSGTDYNPDLWKLVETNEEVGIYEEDFSSVDYLGVSLRTELAVVLAYCDEEYYEATGIHIRMNSGYRSAEYQKRLFGDRWSNKFGSLYYASVQPVVESLNHDIIAGESDALKTDRLVTSGISVSNNEANNETQGVSGDKPSQGNNEDTNEQVEMNDKKNQAYWAMEYYNILREKKIAINGRYNSILQRVALPGFSIHNAGCAIDVDTHYYFGTLKPILLKYGFSDYSEERWHFNYLN